MGSNLIQNMKKINNFGVMFGPCIKSRGTKMSANADFITVETYVQQGKTIENQFFIYEPKC